MTKGYILVSRKVTDQAAAQEYLAAAKPLAEKFGGRYLVRGDAGDTREGTPRPDGFGWVLIEFPSAERAKEFYEAEEYAPVLARGKQGFERDLVILEGFEG